MPFLIVERGNDKDARVEVTKGGRVVFGRAPEADLVTTDHQCSQQHFEIADRGGTFWIRDLGATNGTFVNDERVVERALALGDAITAGETELTFVGDATQQKGLAGKVVGGYRILERVGRGGMGTVYKANQVSLNRVVALKVLSHKVASNPSFVKRFQAEAQAAGGLNHPNIVQVYDVGQEQGLHYYSMEYIENGSVQSLASRTGALDIELAIAIITDAARGLVYAEKRGLVHRDIKPDNLMVNSEGVVKIADLGLALDAGVMARASGEHQGEKHDDGVFGTPHFISPEQALGQKVDTRSDIYSLGATFYRLIVGKTPFQGENIREIIQKQIADAPEPVRDARKGVPPQVAAIIDRMMKKEPAERYQSAQDLLTDLEKLDASLAPKSRSWVAAAAVVVLVGGGVAFWKLRTPDAPTPPVIPASAPTNDEAASRRDRDRETDFERRAREADAIKALGLAQIFEARELQTSTAAGKTPDRATIRARYQELVAKFEGTDAARLAQTTVDQLTRDIEADADRAQAASRAAESRTTEARDALTKAIARAEAEASGDHFGAALGIIASIRAKVNGTPLAADADRAQETLQKRAETRAAEVSAAARDLDQKGDPAAAAALLEKTATDFSAGATGSGGRKFDPLLSTLRSDAVATRARATERDRSDRLADATALYETRRAAAELLAKSLDPTAAAKLIGDAEAALKTASAKAELADAKEDVAALVRVRDQYLERARAALGSKLKLPLPTDPKKTADFTLTGASPTGIVIKRGSTETTLGFASMTPAEGWDLLFRDAVEKNESRRLDCVRYLLVAGRAEKAAEMAQALPDAAAREAWSQRARREQNAWALLQEVRDLAARVGSDESVLGRLHRAASRLLDEFQDTRASVLNRRSPPEVSLAPASRPENHD